MAEMACKYILKLIYTQAFRAGGWPRFAKLKKIVIIFILNVP